MQYVPNSSGFEILSKLSTHQCLAIARIPKGSGLRVEVEATDGNGVPEVKLRLNGLVLNAEKKRDNLFVWSGSSDEILKSLETGTYHLEAVAVDKNGLRTYEEINIAAVMLPIVVWGTGRMRSIK